MKFFLEKDIDVNFVDHDGKTALHHAVKGAKIRVIPVLIKH